ncbi:MAG: metallophosphoesterase [Actinobacteria bacterium]|nr:metallophosphoesterase [Actinomycetota bacterium]
MSQLRRLLGIVVTLALATGTLITAGVSAASAVPGYNANLTRYPYLTDLVGTRVTVNWATTRLNSVSSTGTVTWGAPGSGCNTHSAAATRNNLAVGSTTPPNTQVLEYQWTASIDVGAPGTYCYRVLLGSSKNPPPTPIDLLGTDPSPTFTTQVPAGSTQPFSFAVIGDWGQVDGSGANPNEQAVLAQIANSGVSFAVSTGDNAYNSGTQEDYGDLNQTSYQKVDNTTTPPTTTQVGMSAVFGPNFWTVPGKSIPMFAAVGNHGLVSSDSNGHPQIVNWPQNTAVFTSGGRDAVTTYDNSAVYGPAAKATIADTWYAFDAGNARFYVLTAAWPDNAWGTADPNFGGYANDYLAHWKPGAAEYEWLKADLAAHPGGIKFAFFHKPLQSDTSSLRESTDPYLRSDTPQGGGINSLESLLSRNGVDIAFNGHAHIYERNNPHAGDSLVNYVTGGGGAAPESLSGSTFNCTQGEDAYAISWSPTNGGRACGSASAPSNAGQFFHFLKVTVNGNQVTVTPTNSLGQTFDVQTYNFTPVPAAASSGYVVDAYGGLQPFSVGNAAPLAAPVGAPYWNGFNIARGVALMPNKQGGYVLDGWGGLHPFKVGTNGIAPPAPTGGAYWAGWDIAKGVAIDPDGKGGYVVDAWGGLHPFGIGASPPAAPTDGPYWNGFSIARGVTLLSSGGGYVVDGYGGLHPFTANGATAPPPIGGPYWYGWDIARGVTSTTDGAAGYVVDGYGGLHPFRIRKDAPPVTTSPYWNGWDIARGAGL